jgi:hypothetical protein
VDTAALWARMARHFSLSFIPLVSGDLAAHVMSPLPVALTGSLFFFYLLAFVALSGDL